jgi:hypothetical protein
MVKGNNICDCVIVLDLMRNAIKEQFVRLGKGAES